MPISDAHHLALTLHTATIPISTEVSLHPPLTLNSRSQSKLISILSDAARFTKLFKFWATPLTCNHCTITRRCIKHDTVAGAGWWCWVVVLGGGAGWWCWVVVMGGGAGWWCWSWQLIRENRSISRYQSSSISRCWYWMQFSYWGIKL